jgi:predicted Zn-dependent peptidase
MFDRTALPDGPRVITARVPGARSVSLAAYVLAGSRLEPPELAGAAHFMEHLTFKGTASYPTTRALSEAIEGVGGSFNAATDRESTVYWARVPLREVGRAMHVVGDLVTKPILDAGEIAREKDVIVEEIRSYQDDPAELVGILFDRAMFGEGPLGREIAGDEATVRGLTPEAIRAICRTTRPSGSSPSASGRAGDRSRARSRPRRCLQVTASSSNAATPPRPSSASASPRSVATTPTSGSSRCSTASSARG